MAKVGRKNKYLTHVKPHLKEIELMLQDMTEEQIAKKLGVGYSTWAKYKVENIELRETIKRGNTSKVGELKSILLKRARGFSYQESKVVIEDDGSRQETIYTKQALPDVASINLLLKNYDRENWANDPQALDLKKKELELKEKQVEANLW